MRFNKDRMAKLAGLPQNKRVIRENRRRAILRKRRALLREGRGHSSDSGDQGVSDYFDYNLDDLSDDLSMHFGDVDGDSQSSHQPNIRRKIFDDDTYETSIPASDAMAFLDDVDFMDMDSYDSSGRYSRDMGFDPEDDPEFGMDLGVEQPYGLARLGKGSIREHVSEMAHSHMGEDVDEMNYEMYEMYENDEEKEKKEEMVEIDDKELKEEFLNIKRKRLNEARLKAVIEDELRDVLAEMQYGSGWMYGNNKPQASTKGRITRGFKGLGFK